MKKKLTQFAFCSLITSSALAQTGVHIQEYTDNAYVYNQDSVYMPVSFSTGYSRMAVVNPSTKEWSYLNSTNYNKHLGPFVMKNKLEGVMIYSSTQKVYKTIDGWQTLTEVPNVANAYGLAQIALTDAGYIGYEGSLKDLHFSADGVTWNLAFDGSSGTNVLRAKGNKVILYTGAVSGNYVSTDGGQSFTMVPFGGTFTGTFKDFMMISEDTLLVATSANLYKSFDSGQNWTATAFPASLASIVVKDTAEMYISTGLVPSTQSYYTSDGGATWQMKNMPASSQGAFIGNDLYMWPNYKSSDNGTTFNYFLPKVLASNTLFDINFKGSNGFIGKSGGKVICSNDKGRSFSPDISLPTSEDIMAVKVLNNGDYIAGDRNSQIFYSDDNGQTWTQKYSNTSSFNAFKFSSSANDSIIVETRGGQPVVSSNFGATFNFITAGGGTHTQTVTPAGTIIDAGGWFSYITFQNKGIEISTLTPSGTKMVIDTFTVANGATENVVDVAMANNTIGYLIASNTTTNSTNIYKTTTGFMLGGTTLKNTIASFIANRIHIISADTVILSAAGSTMYYYSYNGGTTWAPSIPLNVHADYPSLYPTIKKAFFFNANESIFALNNYGLYLNVNSSGGSVPTAINEYSEGSSAFETEVAVFPNPANDKIRVSITSIADISMYDYSGRLVFKKANLNSDEELNVSSLPKGLYLLVVQSKSKTTVGKFIKQ